MKRKSNLINSRFFKIENLLFITFCCLFVISARFVFKDRNSSFNSKESNLSVNNIKLINKIHRKQLLYYASYSNFDPNINRIFENEVDYFSRTIDSYNYFFKNENNIAFIYGIPRKNNEQFTLLNIPLWQNKHKPLYGYVAALVFIKNNPWDKSSWVVRTVICKNNKMGVVKPREPIFSLEDKSWTCGRDTREIE